jgi:hypothetical protein
MNRLTADERRRANELTAQASRRVARAVTADQLAQQHGWERNARRAAVIGLGAAATYAVAQCLQQLAVFGPGTLLDWLLPRL